MTQPDLQAELGEPSHPCAIWPAEIDGLEMPFELMLPSVASVVRSHLVERLPTERPDTWARVEASDDGQNGGELGRRAPTSLGVALLLWTALASLLVTHHHFRSSLSAQVLQAKAIQNSSGDGGGECMSPPLALPQVADQALGAHGHLPMLH
jgi:hypothetical protein